MAINSRRQTIFPKRGRQDGNQSVILAVAIVAQRINRRISQCFWRRPGGKRDLSQCRVAI